MEWFNLFNAIITIVIGYVLAKYLTKLLRRGLTSRTAKHLTKKNYNEALIDYSLYFVRVIVYITTVITAVSMLGYAQEILSLVAVVLIISVIAVLLYSIRDFIPNAFAGYYIKNNKIIRKGEEIVIKEFKGKVKEVNLLTTIIEGEKGRVIVIPNNLIMNQIVKKY